MRARRTRGDGSIPSHSSLEESMRSEGLEPRWWSNSPGDSYGRHSHDHQKVLYCADGSIVFHTDDGDISLVPGDRLDIEAGTGHSATVGPDGVTCIEAAT